MRKVAIIGCGAYMDSGYGCPGEWRCLKAASQGEGTFEEPSSVVAFVKCECPGRTVAPNLGMAAKLSEIKPDAIYFSTCLAKAKPECPVRETGGPGKDCGKCNGHQAGAGNSRLSLKTKAELPDGPLWDLRGGSSHPSRLLSASEVLDVNSS